VREETRGLGSGEQIDTLLPIGDLPLCRASANRGRPLPQLHSPPGIRHRLRLLPVLVSASLQQQDRCPDVPIDDLPQPHGLSFVSTTLGLRMQDPNSDDFSATKLHKKKVVYRPLPSGMLKGEPELLRREGPHSSGMVHKPPKRSLKSECPATPPSDRGTPDSLLDSGPTDEYRALRRKYMMLEEENFALDQELSMEDEEIKALEEEKLVFLDELVVLEGLVEPSQLQSHRRP